MERRVAELICDGHTNRSAAAELHLSPSTINTHLRAVFTKLGVHSRVQLAKLVLSRPDEPGTGPARHHDG
jgi:DNA-binding NarL/FixJ family response regulator